MGIELFAGEQFVCGMPENSGSGDRFQRTGPESNGAEVDFQACDVIDLRGNSRSDYCRKPDFRTIRSSLIAVYGLQ